MSTVSRRSFFGVTLGGLLAALSLRAKPRPKTITLLLRNRYDWVEGTTGLRPAGPVTISGRWMSS